jgi:putative ABC transport system permease protein
VTIKWSATDYQTQLNGSVPAFIEVRTYELAGGRFIAEGHLELNRRVAVIGQTVVAEVFKGRDAVGETIMISGQQFTVVGVLAAKGTAAGQDQDDLVIVPLTTAQRLLSSTRITTIYGKLTSPDAAATTIAQIKSIMQRLLGRADQVRVQSQDELLATIDSMTQTMTTMLGAIAGISLLVGGIGIMNIMLVSVTERTREIGLRKAVGARRSHIMTQFMVEALVISLGGGLIGAALGILGSNLIARFGSWNTVVTTASVLLAFGFAAAIGVGFGIYPAIKASALDPITALRYE